MWIKKGGVTVGRADLVDENGNVWEVKHGGSLGTKAMTAIAKAQASKYLGGQAARDDRIITEFGKRFAFKGEFIINCLDDSFKVTYSTPAAGVVLYRVKKVGKREGSHYKITVEAYKRLEVLVTSPTTQRAPSTVARAMIVSAAIGAGAAVFAYAGGFNMNRSLYFY